MAAGKASLAGERSRGIRDLRLFDLKTCVFGGCEFFRRQIHDESTVGLESAISSAFQGQITHLASSSKISSNVALRYHDSVPSSADTATSSDDVVATTCGPLVFFFGADFFRGASGFDDKGTGNSKTLRPFGFNDGVGSCFRSPDGAGGCERLEVPGESKTLRPDPDGLIGNVDVPCADKGSVGPPVVPLLLVPFT